MDGGLVDGLVDQRELRELADLGLEGLRVTLEYLLDGLVPLVLALQRVETVETVAVVAEGAHRETVTVQLQTHRLGTIARLTIATATASAIASAIASVGIS